MQSHRDPSRDHALLPAGRRWGSGAQSVVPYLTHGRASRDQEAVQVEQLISNPVFMHMEHALRVLQRGH